MMMILMMLKIYLNLKGREVSKELPTNPADYMTKTSDISKDEAENQGGSRAQGNGKFNFRSSSVKVSVRKPLSASNSNRPAKQESEQEEQKANVTSIGLQTLCQNYDSNEDN